jgi:5,10-methenyltetrahydromethanopterin hydrogenase
VVPRFAVLRAHALRCLPQFTRLARFSLLTQAPHIALTKSGLTFTTEVRSAAAGTGS